MTTATDLTAKEAALLQAVTEGMDSPGSGWLHEITPFDNDHVTAGVLGSLIAKGLVTSYRDDDNLPGFPPVYWVELVSKP